MKKENIMDNNSILFLQNETSPNNTMFSQASISPIPYSLQCAITLDLLATVILCVVASVCVVFLYHTLFSLVSWLQDMRPSHIHDHDAQNMYSRPSTRSYTVFYRAMLRGSLVRYNAQLIDVVERFVRDIDERRGQRLRDSNRLPPLISYGKQRAGASSGGHDECVICLEDFEDGESCQVFPVCNHIFHTNCIDHWLKNRPTCPVCRNCILDV